jgi:hypothetical protein
LRAKMLDCCCRASSSPPGPRISGRSSNSGWSSSMAERGSRSAIRNGLFHAPGDGDNVRLGLGCVKTQRACSSIESPTVGTNRCPFRCSDDGARQSQRNAHTAAPHRPRSQTIENQNNRSSRDMQAPAKPAWRVALCPYTRALTRKSCYRAPRIWDFSPKIWQRCFSKMPVGILS